MSQLIKGEFHLLEQEIMSGSPLHMLPQDTEILADDGLVCFKCGSMYWIAEYSIPLFDPYDIVGGAPCFIPSKQVALS